MSTLPQDLLTRPAPESVRLLSLHYLDATAQNVGRLADAEDEEALHDFRVALRRLRSTLRAYRRELRGSVKRKTRDRLRDIANSTNGGRDAEVALVWARPLDNGLTARERVGLHWIVEWLEQRREESGARVRKDVPTAFIKLERRLRRDLAVYLREVAEPSPADAPFGALARATLERHAQRLDQLLAEVERAEEYEAIHRARIAAKRLRYILEPLSEWLPLGPALVKRLKSLQDIVGELCDVRVFEDLLRSAVESAGAHRAKDLYDQAMAGALSPRRRWSEQPGVLVVARRLHGRRKALFAKLKTTWLGGNDEFSKTVAALVSKLPTTPIEPATPTPTPVAPVVPATDAASARSARVPVPPRRTLSSRQRS